MHRNSRFSPAAFRSLAIDYEVNLRTLTLSFAENASLEAEFLAHNNSNSLGFIRTGLVLGLLLYGIFGLLDSQMAPSNKELLWIIRYFFVSPVIIIVLAATYHQHLKRYLQFMVCCVLSIAGIGISIMISLTPQESTDNYFIGILLVLMLGYGNSKVRFIWASLAGWLNFAAYEIIALFVIGTAPKELMSSNFFFVSANIIGMLSCYIIEVFSRKQFYIEKMLAKEHLEVVRLNRDLEMKVQERTKNLLDNNRRLTDEIAAHEQAEEERIRLQKQLSQSQKMESIGKLAGGIAHDFNNILAAVLGYTELLLAEHMEDGDLTESLLKIQRAGIRASELTRQILVFARKSDEEFSPIRVRPILEEVLEFVRSTLPVSIEISELLESDSAILGNATQLYQVMLNILTNAAQAIEEENGRIVVSLSDLMDQEGSPRVSIEVSDSGKGIPEDILASIFEPFFTTKEQGKGTGMGLAVVHGIITSYGGEVSFESQPGEMTRCTITLPVTQLVKTPSEMKETAGPECSGHILLVDDEASICEIESSFLRRQGYRVTATTSSLLALSWIKEDSDPFDLMITDLTMPGTSGLQLAKEMEKRRPATPVIVCTGYNEVKDLKENNIACICHKPIDQRELASCILKLLNQRGS